MSLYQSSCSCFGRVYKQKNPRGREINLIPRGNTPVGAEGFEPPTLCL